MSSAHVVVNAAGEAGADALRVLRRHQHVGSKCISLFNDATGERICRSCPVYGSRQGCARQLVWLHSQGWNPAPDTLSRRVLWRAAARRCLLALQGCLLRTSEARLHDDLATAYCLSDGMH